MSDKPPLDNTPAPTLTVFQPPGKDPVDQYINQLAALGAEKQALHPDAYGNTLGVESDQVSLKTSSASVADIQNLNTLASMLLTPELPPVASNSEVILVGIGIFAIGFLILKGKI